MATATDAAGTPAAPRSGDPPRGVIAAVTGTNGKSSVAAFVRQIWDCLGASAVSLGSEGAVSGTLREPLPMLDPGPMPFANYLEDRCDLSADCVVFEAHSTGLDTLVYDGVALRVAAFTNLSPDHLDYHGSIRDYGAAKRRLFDEVLPGEGVAVITSLDSWGQDLVEAVRKRRRRVLEVGRRGDIRLVRLPQAPGDRAVAHVFGKRVELPMLEWPGFGLVNALCAVGVVVAAGARPSRVLDTLGELRPPRGRMELVGHSRGSRVFVDHAHNAGGLGAALGELRRRTPGRVWLVFGCGGDRDPQRRPRMAAIASERADEVIVTDDNPRGEDPRAIRRDVLAGCSGAREVADRREAIAHAIERLKPGDALLIAGRGDETHQIFDDRRIELDDRSVARHVLAALAPDGLG